MGIKIGVFGEIGSKYFHLAGWAMAGLGLTMAILSSHKLLADYCNRKLRESEQVENDNRIDLLPDDILCNIVSRLNAIEASRTNILSRTWRKISPMIPLMKFSCRDDISKNYHDNISDNDKEFFLKAVDQCLKLHSGQKLKAFFLHCCFLNGCHTCHLVQWMQAIAKLDVEELYLGHSCPPVYGEPLDKAFTFSFKLIDGLAKLWKLDLTFCYLETSFVGQCNSLVSLTLRGVPLLRLELSDMLSSCPNLENLEMKACKLPRYLRITGPNLKLEVLELEDCYNVKKLEISNFHLVIIKIGICTEVEISFSSLPKLDRLYLITPGIHYSFRDVQRGLPQLKYLLIQATHKILSLPPIFQAFSNVTTIYLLTRGYPGRDASHQVDMWNFASVLSACPLLEKFYLTVGGPLCREERNAAEWPVLRHKHLERMELSGFSHTQNELEFAKFILTRAEVLRLLVLRARTRRFNGELFCLEGKRYVENPTYAQLVCAKLQKHALSMFARVQIC